jgi:hypothetical protein
MFEDAVSVESYSVTIKFPNWRCYNNATNAIYWRWMGLVKENFYLCDVQVSTYLVDRNEVYNSFREVNFSSYWRFQNGTKNSD